MPDFPIVDSHVHLYDPGRLRFGWMDERPSLKRPHGLADLDAARGSVEIEKIVFVEVAADPGQHVEEAAGVQALADGDPRLAGMVAQLPLERGPDAVAADLEALTRHRTLRGIRRLIQGAVDPSFCLEPLFLDAVRLLGRRGLVFDICIKHWAMVFAIELARRCPDVSFVLDHIGKPGIRLGLREPWWAQMRELARLPNVACKVSGVITEADHDRWSRDDVTPYVAHAVDCFGFERCMFGSDWPVSSLTHGYLEWVEIVDAVVAGATLEERRQLFRDTAIRVYRL